MYDIVIIDAGSGGYHAAIQFPENSNDDNIETNLDKGILKIKIPKKEIEKNEKKEIKIS